ncbi:MAG: hypothetical protein AMXMBFR13_24410 [Phycisphaerae bacterium]
MAKELFVLLVIGLCGLTLLCGVSQAASHSDAPLIKQDPQANITDVYAFIGEKYNNPGENVLNVLVSVRPFSEPGDGVIYERFADDALYSIHITNPSNGETAIRYDFTFSEANPDTTPLLKYPLTILSYGRGGPTEIGAISSVGDPRQNYTQFYAVTRTQGSSTDDVASSFTPPPNVGVRTTPLYNDAQSGAAISGATMVSELDMYTQQGVAFGLNGETFWAGPREDGFYADTAGIFDLLDARIIEDKDNNPNNGLGQDGGGVDGFKGFNVLSFAAQIPISSLPTFEYFAPFFGPSIGVGVYASVSRQRITLRRSNGEPINTGPWVQVNRMGNPLFNEVLVALQDKDRYNHTAPTADFALFETYALDPEIAELINLVFGTNFAETDRIDLAAVYLPDVLRVNTTTDAVLLPGEAGFSRFSFLGNDVLTASNGLAAGGWPNGRRIGDDVVDIALTAVASGPTYASITLLVDNVNANDQVYNQVFPYLATPHAGPNNRKDPPCPP